MSLSLQPVRILHHIQHMNRGTAPCFIMNVYRQMDRSKIQFDFVVHTLNPSDYDEEILALGGRIFQLQKPYKTGWVGYLSEMKSMIRQHGPFQAVHSHTHDTSAFMMLAAKLHGIPVRIAHSHGLSDFVNPLPSSQVSRRFQMSLIKRLATNWVGSPHHATQALFGANWLNDKRGKIMRCGIDVSRFAHEAGKHASLRDRLQIPADAPLIGHIGRFSAGKNHRFLIEIFEDLLYRVKDARLILVGDGALRPQIQDIIEQKELQGCVHLIGVQEDLQELLQELDVLVLPSIRDGLPMVVIEAQAAGVACVVSDVLPKEANVQSGFFTFVSLNQDMAVWVQWIIQALRSERSHVDLRMDAVRQAGYDIKAAASILEDVYTARIG